MKPTLLLSLVMLLAAGCATVPPPIELLTAADAAIQRADATRGGEPSAAELRSARAKLAAARDANTRGERLLATRLAEQARLGAELATARIEAARAQFSVEAMRKGNEALQQQGLRDSVNVAPIAIPAPEPEVDPYALPPPPESTQIPVNQ